MTKCSQVVRRDCMVCTRMFNRIAFPCRAPSVAAVFIPPIIRGNRSIGRIDLPAKSGPRKLMRESERGYRRWNQLYPDRTAGGNSATSGHRRKSILAGRTGCRIQTRNRPFGRPADSLLPVYLPSFWRRTGPFTAGFYTFAPMNPAAYPQDTQPLMMCQTVRKNLYNYL